MQRSDTTRVALAIALAAVLAGGCAAEPEPAVSQTSSAEVDSISSFDINASGRRFRVNGAATFLLGVSYFTGLAATPARIHTDFTRLHGRGFNLVRVWPLWNNQSQGGPRIELFRNSGAIDEPTMTALLGLLDEARARNLIVDLTFDKGYYPTMSAAVYRTALAQVASRIAAYHGVIIDIANEVKPAVLTQDQIATIRDALPAYPGRIATASVPIGLPWGDHHIPLLSSYVTTGDLDVADAHCCRDDAWPDTTTTLVRQVRADACCGAKPIYFSEPNRCVYPGIGGGATQDCAAAAALADFKQAAQNCKLAGCAGWVFHTAASYFLNQDTLLNNYRFAVESNAEAQLAAAVNAVAWGS